MNRFFSRVSLVALLGMFAVALPACDREDPTTIGGALVENGAVRTFEITLPASDFLVRDTAFAAFPPPFTNVLILANSFQGALNAHTLNRFSVSPFITVDSAGTVKLDSVPKLLSGALVIHFDTTGTTLPGPSKLRLYRIAEPWDTAGVTWRVRQTTGTLWTTPGGTRGALLDSATYAGGDSVVFRVDTAIIKILRDNGATDPGLMVTSETPETRLRIGIPNLRIQYKSSYVDTAVAIQNFPYASRFIFDPPIPAASSAPRVGGTPNSFRSVFELKPNLKDIIVSCPFTPTCRVRLGDASIAQAHLLLQPTPAPAGFVPELPVTILAYTLLPTTQIPLIRAPLGIASGFLTVGPSSFTGPGAAVIPLNVTTFVRDLVAPIDTTTFNSRYLTLLQGGSATFGYATFAAEPKLRLRLSLAQEIQLP